MIKKFEGQFINDNSCPIDLVLNFPKDNSPGLNGTIRLTSPDITAKLDYMWNWSSTGIIVVYNTKINKKGEVEPSNIWYLKEQLEYSPDASILAILPIITNYANSLEWETEAQRAKHYVCPVNVQESFIIYNGRHYKIKDNSNTIRID
jgi:hypothetical protein